MNTLKTFCGVFMALALGSGAYSQSTFSIRPVHIGLIYPVSTNGAKAVQYSNLLSLHAIAGVSGAETGLALAGVCLVVKDSAIGLQCSGLINKIGGKARGVQLAGLLNLTGSAAGLSAAGFANISHDSAGNQLAGFINIAKKVRGVQIAGFINIADSSDYPIAILNFIRNGEKSLGLSFDETSTGLLSFRSGGRRLYSILSLGYNNRHGDSLFVWQTGLGVHFPVTTNFRINVEGVTTGMTDFKREDYFRATLRGLPSFRFAHRLELYAGPSINYIKTERGRGNGLVSHYLWSEKEGSGVFHGLYVGVSGGINVIL